MNANAGLPQRKAFSLLELLVVMVVILIVAAVLLPPLSNHNRPSKLLACMNRLRQIGLAVQMYVADNSGHYPGGLAQAPNQNATTPDFEAQAPASYFTLVAPYLHLNQLLLCPSETSRKPAPQDARLTNTNVSYFVSLSVTNPASSAILAGDRHLALATESIAPGLFLWTNNANVTWSRELHSEYNGGRGTLLFADTHSEVCFGSKLAARFNQQALAANRLAIP